MAAIALAFLRYAPLVGDVRDARQAAQRLADVARSLGTGDLDRASVDRLRGDLDELDGRLMPVRNLLAGDPLVDLARQLPAAAVQVEAAEALVQAADSLLEAGHIGIDLADRVVSLRESNDADPEFELLPGLVGSWPCPASGRSRLGVAETAKAQLAGI
jgi:hypothetical protein